MSTGNVSFCIGGTGNFCQAMCWGEVIVMAKACLHIRQGPPFPFEMKLRNPRRDPHNNRRQPLCIKFLPFLAHGRCRTCSRQPTPTGRVRHCQVGGRGGLQSRMPTMQPQLLKSQSPRSAWRTSCEARGADSGHHTTTPPVLSPRSLLEMSSNGCPL